MSSFTIPVMIGLGGFVGALARFYLSTMMAKVTGEEFTFSGTMTVNLTGCFLIGVLTVVVTNSTSLSPAMQKCLIVGLLGSLTTFSTFALESLNLLQAGRIAAALANVSINVVAGLVLVWLGMLAAGCFAVSGETP